MAQRKRFERGIYLLPTLFTVGNLFCGFTAVVHAFHGEIKRAALFIIIAGVLDLLDGRIARLTGTTSDFGSEFDSLADIVSFGISPAMLAYAWVLEPFSRLGMFVAFLFVLCAAMRLARFNIQAHGGEKRHFVGLSSPVAAGSMASVAFAFPTRPELGDPRALPLLLFVATLGLLMVSRFRYRSFKDFGARDRKSYLYVLPLALTMVAIAIWPRWAMLTVAGAYLCTAPLGYLGTMLLRLLGRPRAKEDTTHETIAPR